ncbi:MAG TPA: type II toxin-antitoxin system RelE/ParE family toxin [Pseudomonadota bacterium]|nr:type II toxin-antitoxin system RelE/ParE family toxin [Pseudomonadota bacterium]
MGQVAFAPRALHDFEAAAAWYQRQRPALSARFRKAVNDCIKRIAATPRLWPRMKEGARRASVQGFPYGVYYVERGDRIHIAAIMHHRRHPDSWAGSGGQGFDDTKEG